jgi:hypothetical protein
MYKHLADFVEGRGADDDDRDFIFSCYHDTAVDCLFDASRRNRTALEPAKTAAERVERQRGK